MLLNNNNKKFMKTLSDNCLKANKMRNRIALLAIILTAVLFTAFATVVQGQQYSAKEQQLRQSGTRFMANVKGITLEKAKEIMSNPSFADTGLTNPFALAKNSEFSDIRTIVAWADDNMAKQSYMEPEKGRLPEEENEIACDSEVLKALGLPYKVGSEFTLKYQINDEMKEAKMKICGIWKGQKYESSTQILVSDVFLKKHLKEDINQKTVAEGYAVYGSFKDSSSLGDKIRKIATEAGYNPKAEYGEEGYISYNTNSVYQTKDTVDNTVIISAAACILIVLLAGYLIIYNIFRISIMKDIRLYGQLKTIGTSPKQIRYMIRRQGLKLAVLGIPAGLILGWLVGNMMLPIIMKSLTFNESRFIMPNIWVWIFAAAFTFLTVLISVSSPGRLAGKISPVDALRYQESDNSKKSSKRGMESRNRILQMAFSNLGRNKGKTVLVVLSICISVILLNSVLNLTGSMDKETYIQREISSDFDITGKEYQTNYDEDYKNVVPQKFVEAIAKREEVKELGKVYYRGRMEQDEMDNVGFVASITSKNGTAIPEAERSGYLSQMYGYNEEALKRAEVIEGTVDYEKLRSGKYIVLCGSLNDEGEFDSSILNMHAGDKLKAVVQGEEKEFEVLAVLGVPGALETNYSFGGYLAVGFAENVFLEQFPDNQNPIHCIFNVKEGTFDDVNAYVQELGKTMNIRAVTRLYAEEQFKDFVGTFNGAGSVLGFIFGMIGILNLLNVVLTGAIARRGEFAAMRSVGMTRKQLRKLFVMEGLLYAAAAGIAGIILSAVLSLTMVKGLTNALWMTKYYFTVMPAVYAALICILAAAVIASMVDRLWNKGSIVENLRKTE